MTMLSLYAPPDRSEVRRYSLSAAFVVGVHVLLICTMLFWYTQPDIHGTGTQPFMIDLETADAMPDAQKLDLAAGELSREAPPPTLEPVEKKIVEKKEEIAPAPIQDKPDVVAPPEQKEKPKPVKDEQKPVEKKPLTQPAGINNTAPRAASQAALADYNGLVAAHLLRFNRPTDVPAQGTAKVSFTLNRSGQVLSSRLVKSSGSPALDAEAMAMIRRAQPYPTFLAAMDASTLSFDVPINFKQR